jgi:hypothetical protein
MRNVGSLSITGELKGLCHEMENYTWNVLGLAEDLWPGMGEIYTGKGRRSQDVVYKRINTGKWCIYHGT